MDRDLIIKRLRESCRPEIWTVINQHYQLEVAFGDGGEPLFCYARDGVLRLYVPASGLPAVDLAYLALRIYLRAKGFFVQEWLQLRFESEPLLNWVLDANLFLQLGHILEGWLICTMGLHNEGEHGEGRAGDDEWSSVFSLPLARRGFGRPVPPPAAIHAFILSYFRTQGKLVALKEVCPSLHAILERFHQQWLQLDLYSDHSRALSRQLLDNLVSSVGRWATAQVLAKKR